MLRFYQMSPEIMAKLMIYMVILPFITLSSLISPSNQAHLISYFYSGKDAYTQNSTYQTNLVNLFSELTSVASFVHSYNATFGSDSDTVHASFYCRHDLSSELCHSCVIDASDSILQLCPYEMEARIWYEECTLRYGSESVVESEMEEVTPWTWWHSSCGVKEKSRQDQHFKETLGNLIKGLIRKSTSGDKPKLFAGGEAFVNTKEKLYVTVECSPWISPYRCKKCMRTAWRRGADDCAGASWAVAFLTSCQVRYELGPFPPSFSSQLLPQRNCSVNTNRKVSKWI